MFLKALLWILLAYFLYRFVFNFLVPVFRVSRQMRKQVRDFRDTMNHAQQQQHTQGHQGGAAQPQRPSPSNTSKAGDYIDFEEIK